MNAKLRLAIFSLLAASVGCASENQTDNEEYQLCSDTLEAYYCDTGSSCCQGSCCDTGNYCCSGGCFAPSVTNCGGCGITCKSDQTCQQTGETSWACVCPSTGSTCQGTCCANGCVLDMNSDSQNCGSCGHKCNDGEICSSGHCELTCQTGTERCETGSGAVCANLNTSTEHCGGCNQSCPSASAESLNIAASYCLNGSCGVVCLPGYSDLDQNAENGCEHKLPVCGNGIVEEGEVCDGASVNEKTCEEVVGFGSTGQPACNSTCTDYDIGTCTAEVKCGNGILDTSEECDGSEYQFGHNTCAKYNFEYSSGELNCVNCVIDDSECIKRCGNGQIDSGEVCDGSNLNGKTCSDIVGNGSKGNLQCSSTCKEFDKSGCSASQNCGNGKLDIGEEECDGTYFHNGIKTCAKYNGEKYISGELKCASNCSIDESGCVLKCGNGKIDTGEECDGENFNGETCESWKGYGSTGSLSCDSSCKINASKCSAVKTCGNGILDTTEACDGTLFRNGYKTCSEYDKKYISGNLKCTGCEIDLSSCVLKCGNDQIDSGEVCDGTFFGNKTCANVVGHGSEGVLKCINCQSIDSSGCSATVLCGNGVLDTSEACDPSAPAGQQFSGGVMTCSDKNSKYISGNLSCNSNCTINTSACVLRCGDGQIQSGEVCDGKNLNGETCAGKFGDSKASGTPVCNESCSAINYDDCIYCGDGIKNGSEECDGTDWGKITDCYSYNNKYAAGSGSISCTSSCTFNVSSCVDACSQDSVRCSAGGTQIEKCGSNGLWSTYQTCASTIPHCELVNSQPTCVCQSDSECGSGKICENGICRNGCTEGLIQCATEDSNNIVQQCTSGRWTKISTCSGSTPYCSNGSCAACTQDSHCTGSRTCSDNKCISTCTEDSLRCSTSVIERCNSSGEWETYINCPTAEMHYDYCFYTSSTNYGCAECLNDSQCSSGEVCSGYVCAECTTEGAYQCDTTGNIVQKCSSGHWVEEINCQDFDATVPICLLKTNDYDCVECVSDANCSGSASYCLTTNNTCVGCLEDTHCSSGFTCNMTTHACESSSGTVTNYSTDFEWLPNATTSNVNYTTSYIMPDTEGFSLTATGRIYLLNSSTSYAIDEKGILIRTDDKPASVIAVTDLTKGIGTIEFDVYGWDAATVYIEHGSLETTTSTSDQDAPQKTRTHVSFTINAATDTKFTIKSRKRVTIDNLSWTSAN